MTRRAGGQVVGENPTIAAIALKNTFKWRSIGLDGGSARGWVMDWWEDGDRGDGDENSKEKPSIDGDDGGVGGRAGSGGRKAIVAIEPQT